MSLYRRLLRRFAVDHGDDIAQVRKHLAAGDKPAARRMAHSLKGMGATLGAEGVRAAAASLEAAIIADAQLNDETERLCGEAQAVIGPMAEGILACLGPESAKQDAPKPLTRRRGTP